MPYYKDIYYAGDTTGMSVTQISYSEAANYGDKIETIGFDVPLHVGSAAERDAKYPTPFVGTSVWRTDLGLEQRYEQLDSAVGAYWYTFTTGMMLIRPDDYVFGGSTSGSNGVVNDNGSIVFTNKNTVYLNGIFGPAFKNYKVFFNLKNTSAGTDVYFQFTNQGTADSSALYSCSSYYANSATVVPVQELTRTNGALLGSATTVRNALCELTLFQPYTSNPSFKAASNGVVTGAGAAPWVWNQVGYFNSTTAVFDGIVFFTGSADMSGTIMVYGFN